MVRQGFELRAGTELDLEGHYLLCKIGVLSPALYILKDFGEENCLCMRKGSEDRNMPGQCK